jgi:hypothetical protein
MAELPGYSDPMYLSQVSDGSEEGAGIEVQDFDAVEARHVQAPLPWVCKNVIPQTCAREFPYLQNMKPGGVFSGSGLSCPRAAEREEGQQ